MFVKLAAIFLTLGCVSGQSQKCIPNAGLDSNGDCQCNNGFMGSPDLCCYQPAQSRACYMLGDPVLTSLSGQKISVDFPCGVSILSSQAIPNCRVDVNSYEVEVQNGAILTREVSVTMTGAGKVSLKFGDRSGLSFVYVNNGPISTYYEYQLSQPLEIETFGRIPVKPVVSFDKDLNLFFVDACGIKLNVRPAEGSSAQQKFFPGLCVMPPTGASTSQGMCQFNKDLDTLSADQKLSELVSPLKSYYTNPSSLRALMPVESWGNCDAFSATMNANCQAQDRDGALKKCAFLLYQPVIRRCAYEASDVTGADRSMKPFLKCVSAYCKGDQDTCDALKADAVVKTCAPSLLTCASWPVFRRVNSFVAGEGESGENLSQEQNADNGGDTEETTFDPLANGILGNENGNDAGDTAGGIDDDGFDLGNFI